MKLFKLSEMKDGWFVGNFKPSAYRTRVCEAGFKFHYAGQYWPKHFHKKVTEINLLVNGVMEIKGRTLVPQDIFVIKPREVVKPKFVTDCILFVVKIPGIRKDKVIV